MKTLHDVTEPDINVELFGQKLAMPVIGAAVAGAAINFKDRMNEVDLAKAQVFGALEAGTIAMIGDGPGDLYDKTIEALKGAGKGIAIIKPRKLDEMIRRIRMAEEAGAVAVGVDVDAAGLVNMRRSGEYVGPLSLGALRKICESTKLPVIIKGIMTEEEAVMASDAGAGAIVVSNHGGRVLDDLPGTISVLPGIASKVQGRSILLADGGVRSGSDVLKFIACGADAVLVGRPVVWGAFGGGKEGVRLLYEKLADELRIAMILTSCPSIKEVSMSILQS
jgi:isopentenyl diphosphate isomerase/L-lactate dehydrogenase-like FMN-dependent dehydrogenase